MSSGCTLRRKSGASSWLQKNNYYQFYSWDKPMCKFGIKWMYFCQSVDLKMPVIGCVYGKNFLYDCIIGRDLYKFDKYTS